ncbi:homogentisate 1,2-dioxygenase [Aliikangiella maris]|uniref:Homogentisate 1,2-dioxygenase n=2 Tax=Aliikangiella maris TaxID=3162458 RepID=A0ABV2BSA5_9GAMM
MPFYIRQGKIPHKRHIKFEKENGELYREELFSTHGFSNIYSNKYHHNMPCKVSEVKPHQIFHGEQWRDSLLQNYKVHTSQCNSEGNFFESRKMHLFNDDVAIYTAKVTEDTSQFYRNAYADEIVFVHQGSGELTSEYGNIRFEEYDYLVIPKGTTYQLKFDDYSDNKLMVIESATMVTIPAHYRIPTGQLTESAPYCERDIRTPILQDAKVEEGEFELVIKYGAQYQVSVLQWHPYDLVGWDGACYPWAFNMKEFAPKVGQIHLPPSDHLVFTANNFVVCNFVPRLYDFHKEAIPAPYYHTNIDSDEVLYYVHGNFMSRTDIEPGSITLHPKGIPHGPQPGKTEESIGVEDTFEYAVMVDTFVPLKLTDNFRNCMVKDYNQSWLEK